MAVNLEKPSIASEIAAAMGYDVCPNGSHAVVMFAEYSYNQEDAIIMNQASIDRGQHKIYHIVTHEHILEGNSESFGIPPYNETHDPRATEDKYSKVNPVHGIPTKVGMDIYKGDVIRASYRPLEREETETIGLNKKYKDTSQVYTEVDRTDSRHPSPAKVVYANTGMYEKSQRKSVELSIPRFPVIGDKFSSEYGQKGTIGACMPVEKMPYTADGIRPDIIFSPAAVIRRETYGHLFTAIIAKALALLGTNINCTPFINNIKVGDFDKVMEAMGFESSGYETVYDPATGNKMKTKMYIGVNYYVRQRHMVDDKAYARSDGPKQPFSRHPAKGKKKEGGLRWGEQEVFATQSAGAANVDVDYLKTQCAPFHRMICEKCGGTAYLSATNRGQVKCDKCGVLPSGVNRYAFAPYTSVLAPNILFGGGVEWTTHIKR